MNCMIQLSVWNNEKSIHSIEIEEDKILEFRINNRRTYTTKNTFKKFVKVATIRIENEWYNIIERDIPIVKELVKGEFLSNKYTHYEYKNGAERKATDWYFTRKERGE